MKHSIMQPLKSVFALIISLLLVNFAATAQDQKETDFKKTCDALLQSIARKKLAGLNSLINPAYGVYVLYRMGVYDQYVNQKKLANAISFSLEYCDVKASDLKKYQLKYDKLPSYDCGDAMWNKRGYTTDSVKKFRPMSEIIAFNLKYEQRKTGKKEKATISYIEQLSRKVVFTGSKGDGIIFYLAYINGKWWLSVIDNVTMDCSA